MLLVHGQTTAAVLIMALGYHAIMVMGFAIRRHVLKHLPDGAQVGAFGATFSDSFGVVFVMQSSASGGGRLGSVVSFSTLALLAHSDAVSPLGYRDPNQIHRIVRKKSACAGTYGFHR